jgi:hypothetical protein
MRHLVLSVFPPWSQDGKGLRWAVQQGHTEYYRQWAHPEKWVPDTALLAGPARNDRDYIFKDERVDPMPVLCDEQYYGDDNDARAVHRDCLSERNCWLQCHSGTLS